MKTNIFKRSFYIFLFAVIATFLWGSAIPVIKIGYEAFNITSDNSATQILFAGIRFFIAGIMVIIFKSIALKKICLPQKQDFKAIIPLGLVQTALQYIFFYLSLSNLSGIKGTIINSIGNFFAVILAAICFKNDKLTFKKIIGCILGFGGVIICNLQNGSFDFSFNLFGEGFMICAAFCFALGSVITKLTTKNSDPALVTGCQLSLGGIILTIIGLILGGAITTISIKAIFILLYLAGLSSIAFSLWAELLKHNDVGKIAIYGFLNPIFGVILSGILLNEDFLNIYTFSALILVSIGIFIINRRTKQND